MDPRYSYIEKIANAEVRKHKLAVPIDPMKFCQDVLGYTILEYEDDDSVLAVIDRANMLVGINKKVDNFYRLRFSVAHEIGHYYLHKSLIEFRDEQTSFKNADKIMEREADCFAAEFLMPSHLLKEQFKNCPFPDKLTAIFQVSKEAMWIKLKNLKLI